MTNNTETNTGTNTTELVLERVVDVTPEQIWDAWTQPEHITKWFTPAPWSTPEAETDVRPGGIFRTVMCSPEGERVDSSGCFVEVDVNRRLMWTSALGPGYRPNDFSEGRFPVHCGAHPGTRGWWHQVHRNRHPRERGDRTNHENMGFVEGWGAALDQLVAYMKSV